jgi:RNA polymerase sigma-70 factor (ECF subfamily)
MAESEIALLERFAGTGDTEAFAQIVRQYAGLVYGTCLRILADADEAADATQETFFQLMKRSGEVRGSLAGWLHRVATGKAVDLIRRDSARRQRERQHADDSSSEDRTWREVSPYVDEALSQLDDPTRDLLVGHYLEGRSMADLARRRGVSRPTISREIESGLAKLRAQLQRQGVLVAAGALCTLLAQSTGQSAPAAVLQQLGRIALVGAKAAPTASLSSVLGYGLAAAAKVKVVILAAVVVAGAGLIAYTTWSSGPSQAPSSPPAAGRPSRQTPTRTTVGSDQPKVQETAPAGQPVAQLPTEAVRSGATASSEQPAAQPTADTQPATPWWSTTSKEERSRLDLSTPEAAVRSFTKAIASGDAESVMACMLPGGTDFQDIREILNAGPDDPAQQGEYEMKLWFQSLDPDAEMPIIESVEDQGAMKMTWQVTFKKDVTLGGQTLRAGDTYNLDATLRRSGDSWLIDNL